MKTNLPNFLMVGAPKSGTTSLYYYLDQHPDIFMSPVKEPQFFMVSGWDEETFRRQIYPNPPGNYLRTFKQYQGLFRNADNARVVGEGSTSYLYYHEHAIANIRKFIPDWQALKILIILRNPIEASYSHYLMYRASGREPLTFEEAFYAQSNRISEGYLTLAHFDRFRYTPQIRSYLDHFERVKILLFDDLRDNLPALLREVFDFLEVDREFTPTHLDRINATGIPKHAWLHHLLFRENLLKRVIRPIIRLLIPKMQRASLREKIKVKNIAKPSMSEEMRMALQDYFLEDIRLLEEVINRDLNCWMWNRTREGETTRQCNTTT